MKNLVEVMLFVLVATAVWLIIYVIVIELLL